MKQKEKQKAHQFTIQGKEINLSIWSGEPEYID